MTDDEIVDMVRHAQRLVQNAVGSGNIPALAAVGSPLVAAVFGMLVHDHEPAWRA